MEISYQLTERDFVQAYRTYRDRTTLTKWAGRTALWVSLLVVVSILFGLIAQHDDRLARSYLPIPCLALFFIFALEAWPRWVMKRQFRKQPGAQGPRTVIFDAHGVHWRWDGGSADVAWKNYIRWTESKEEILLYTSPAGFSILPKRAVEPAQLSGLREVLKQNIHPAK